MGRKAAILEAATRLFAQRGFSATPTSAIAKEAGVAEGLVFHYFDTKEGILFSLLEEMTESYLSGSRDRLNACATGLDAVKAFIRFHFEFSRKNSDALAVLIRDFPFSAIQTGKNPLKIMENGVDSVTGLWEECINRGKEDGTIREVSTMETALLLRGMLIGASRLQILGPMEVPDLTAHIVEFCITALRENRSKGEKEKDLSSGDNP